MSVRGPSGTLVCRSGGRSRAVLLFRDLRPEDFLLLHPSRSDYEFVEETAPLAVAPPSGENPPSETAPGDGGGRVPAGWDSSLAAFLRSSASES